MEPLWGTPLKMVKERQRHAPPAASSGPSTPRGSRSTRGRHSAAADQGQRKHVRQSPRGATSPPLKPTWLDLPIQAHKREILESIAEVDVTLIVGETGSGKSTQIPKWLLLEGPVQRDVIVTQPRRVAAVTLARRVAAEAGVQLGREVGYKVRFDECHAPGLTRLTYLTDGMFLRDYLRRESEDEASVALERVVVLDEVHERSLRTDIALGLLKQALYEKRKRVKLVIMSATMDVELFIGFFGRDRVRTLTVSGRRFPVSIYYTPRPVHDYLDAALLTIFQIHLTCPLDGDILVFLPGQDDIEAAKETLLQQGPAFVRLLQEQPHRANHATDKAEQDASSPLLYVVPMYAALPSHLQLLAFQPLPKSATASQARKVILATNIAETSVTLPNIKYVIDSGLAKLRLYHPNQGIESLMVTPISKASARQRAGRAGRELPGICYRLYTEDTFCGLAAVTPAEVKRANLAFTALFMKAVGIQDILAFDFLEPPPLPSLKGALEELLMLRALDDQGRLTPEGKQMALFPLDPVLAKVIIASASFGCLNEVVTIVSLLSTENLFMSRHAAARQEDQETESSSASHPFGECLDPSGDHMTLYRLYEAYAKQKSASSGTSLSAWALTKQVSLRALTQATKIRGQLLRYAQTAGLAPSTDAAAVSTCSAGDLSACVLKSFLAGYAQRVAFLQPDKTYAVLSPLQAQPSSQHRQQTQPQRTARLHPQSTLFQKHPKCILYHELVFTTKSYLRGVSRIDPLWLQQSLSS